MHGLEKDVQPLVDLYKKNNEAKWVKNRSPIYCTRNQYDITVKGYGRLKFDSDFSIGL